MKTLFTPRPWEVIGTEVFAENKRWVVAFLNDAPFNEEEFKANGRLIATAPDLLEALKEVVIRLRMVISDVGDAEAVQLADKAIAKATGEKEEKQS